MEIVALKEKRIGLVPTEKEFRPLTDNERTLQVLELCEGKDSIVSKEDSGLYCFPIL